MAGDRIRILIVDDVAESRDNVEKLLRFEPDVEVVGKAERGGEGVAMAVDLKPDVILMDINMPDMDGIEATTQISTRLPSAAVIMMSVQNEPDVLRRAMLAGAREFLSKPFSLDELIQAVRHVSKLSRPVISSHSPTFAAPEHAGNLPRDVSDSKVISVVGNKGGVGRSFIATNLAVALRKRTGKSVILVDANFHFGDIGVMLNSGDSRTIMDVAGQAQTLDQDIMDSVLFTHSSGIRVLQSPPSPQDGETITLDDFRSAMNVASSMAEYVVVDTRPGVDDVVLNALDMSETILLLLTMEMTAIKDTRHFLEISELLGYSRDRISLVLNRTNTYSGIPSRDIGENLGREIRWEIPEDHTAVLNSINEGTPLVESRPEHRISLEIARIAADVAAIEELATAGAGPAARAGLMSRLRTAFRPPS